MNRIFEYLFGVTAISSIFAAAIILVIDLNVPLGVTVSALYVIPILISLLANDRRLTFGLAALLTAFVVVGYFFSPDVGVSRRIVLADRIIVTFVLWVTAFLGTEMTKAKQQIRELGQLLTICAWTKQIKVDGRWISIEEYLTKHHDLSLTHGISEQAAEKVRKELDLEIR